MEIDIVAESKCGRVVLVEVRKTQTKMGLKAMSEFQEKVEIDGKIFSIYLIIMVFLLLVLLRTLCNFAKCKELQPRVKLNNSSQLSVTSYQ